MSVTIQSEGCGVVACILLNRLYVVSRPKSVYDVGMPQKIKTSR